ncbi:class I SAM-dependent methyltransferase [Candidatus Woesearchaeota archaeon]|nr:class I SAM-dependent methyltransferase [Candidatus Woesearchaeota archaeon]
MDNILASMWEEFVGKRSEMEKEFYRSILCAHDCNRIFDAATGTGDDSIDLILAGFDVTSNEINEDLRIKSHKKAGESGVELVFTSYDWRKLPGDMIHQYDGMICLGNSLTILRHPGEQAKALRKMRRSLRDGGVLIVDQRNYDYILDSREDIINNGLRFKYEIRYCGKTIRARPCSIRDNLVVMEYVDNKARQGPAFPPILKMYPFRFHELRAQIINSGFRDVTSYSDLELGYNRDADFHQHVCVK